MTELVDMISVSDCSSAICKHKCCCNYFLDNKTKNSIHANTSNAGKINVTKTPNKDQQLSIGGKDIIYNFMSNSISTNNDGDANNASVNNPNDTNISNKNGNSNSNNYDISKNNTNNIINISNDSYNDNKATKGNNSNHEVIKINKNDRVPHINSSVTKIEVKDEIVMPSAEKYDNLGTSFSYQANLKDGNGVFYRSLFPKSTGLNENMFCENADNYERYRVLKKPLILSYPQYCRYKCLEKRLRMLNRTKDLNLIIHIMGKNFVQALPSFDIDELDVYFCRDTVAMPEFKTFKSELSHLAPKLKGRKRKKKNYSKYFESDDSNESEFYSDQIVLRKSTSRSSSYSSFDFPPMVQPNKRRKIHSEGRITNKNNNNNNQNNVANNVNNINNNNLLNNNGSNNKNFVINNSAENTGVFNNNLANTTLSNNIINNNDYNINANLNNNNLVNNRELFFEKLHKFMDDIQSPISKNPILGFKEVDLHQFYVRTQRKGGYDEVTRKRLWKEIYVELGGSTCNTSAATGTRKNYEKYLQPFENFINNQGQQITLSKKCIKKDNIKNKTIIIDNNSNNNNNSNNSINNNDIGNSNINISYNNNNNNNITENDNSRILSNQDAILQNKTLMKLNFNKEPFIIIRPMCNNMINGTTTTTITSIYTTIVTATSTTSVSAISTTTASTTTLTTITTTASISYLRTPSSSSPYSCNKTTPKSKVRKLSNDLESFNSSNLTTATELTLSASPLKVNSEINTINSGELGSSSNYINSVQNIYDGNCVINIDNSNTNNNIDNNSNRISYGSVFSTVTPSDVITVSRRLMAGGQTVLGCHPMSDRSNLIITENLDLNAKNITKDINIDPTSSLLTVNIGSIKNIGNAFPMATEASFVALNTDTNVSSSIFFSESLLSTSSLLSSSTSLHHVLTPLPSQIVTSQAESKPFPFKQRSSHTKSSNFGASKFVSGIMTTSVQQIAGSGSFFGFSGNNNYGGNSSSGGVCGDNSNSRVGADDDDDKPTDLTMETLKKLEEEEREKKKNLKLVLTMEQELPLDLSNKSSKICSFDVKTSDIYMEVQEPLDLTKTIKASSNQELKPNLNQATLAQFLPLAFATMSSFTPHLQVHPRQILSPIQQNINMIYNPGSINFPILSFNPPSSCAPGKI